MKGLPLILVLVGPTASGKSAVGVKLAKSLGGEILSADSRQIYRGLNIGTAKPSLEEREGIEHHMIDAFELERESNAGEFGEMGRQIIQEIQSRGHLPIVVGGSGLYVRSLVDGLFKGPGADHELRGSLQRRLARDGIGPLVDELRRVDPHSASSIDPTKPRRVIRALEVWHLSGQRLSSLQQEKVAIPFAARFFALDWPRKILYERINARCEKMLKSGLLGEVEALEARGLTDSVTALNTVGYREAFAYRRGEISYETMVRTFKQNSRHYAKRQLTWFKGDPRIRWIPVEDEAGLDRSAQEIVQLFPEK